MHVLLDGTLTVVDVPDVDLFVRNQIGRVQQVSINGTHALQVHLAVGYAGAMDLRFEKSSVHDKSASEVNRSVRHSTGRSMTDTPLSPARGL